MSEAAQWFVYILRCADDSYYTGVTTHCQRREREHNGQLQGGARYTQGRRPVVMIWSQRCDSRSEACKRESKIKKLPRAKKQILVENPTSNTP